MDCNGPEPYKCAHLLHRTIASATALPSGLEAVPPAKRRFHAFDFGPLFFAQPLPKLHSGLKTPQVVWGLFLCFANQDNGLRT